MNDRLVGDDLHRIVMLALDLAYYRSSPIGEDLARAAMVELRIAVEQLPEAKEVPRWPAHPPKTCRIGRKSR